MTGRIAAEKIKLMAVPRPPQGTVERLIALGDATVNQVAEAIPSPPTAMAVRRMMHILEEKGHLRRRESGREVVYAPRLAKEKAGRRAFERVLETFFGGSLEEAVKLTGLFIKEGPVVLVKDWRGNIEEDRDAGL